MKSADDFVALIREMIREELARTDTTVICRVHSVNTDNTVNLYLMPDISNLISNIPNASKFDLKAGDNVVLYKIQNQVNNAFIIAKLNP